MKQGFKHDTNSWKIILLKLHESLNQTIINHSLKQFLFIFWFFSLSIQFSNSWFISKICLHQIKPNTCTINSIYQKQNIWIDINLFLRYCYTNSNYIQFTCKYKTAVSVPRLFLICAVTRKMPTFWYMCLIPSSVELRLAYDTALPSPKSTRIIDLWMSP